MIEDGMLEYDFIKNIKGAPKKVFRLGLRGFCYMVSEGNIFPNTYAAAFRTDGKLNSFTSFLEQWKHLHEGIECFYILFMKYREQTDFTEAVKKMLLVFREACSTSYNWRRFRIVGNSGLTGITEDSPIENVFWNYLIKNLLTLPKKTGYAISFDDIVEIFNNSPGLLELKVQMDQILMESNALSSCYKKYF